MLIFNARVYKDIALITMVNESSIGAVRLDTIIASTLVEFVYIIKYYIFILFYSLNKLVSSENMIFLSSYEKEEVKLI